MPLWKTRFKKSGNSSKSSNNNSTNKYVASNAINGASGSTVIDSGATVGEPSINVGNENVHPNINGGVHPPSLPPLSSSLSMSDQQIATAPVSSTTNGRDISGNYDKLGQKQKKEAELLVIIKDFKGTNKKEMSVHRGQVVQKMYSCGTWLNVQNVEGQNGYIPTDICCPKDDVKDSTWCEFNKDDDEERDGEEEESMEDRLYENILDNTTRPVIPRIPPTTTAANTALSPSFARTNNIFSSSTTPTPPLPYSRSVYPDTVLWNGAVQQQHKLPPRKFSCPPMCSTDLPCNSPSGGSAPQQVPVRKLSGTPMGVIDLGESPPVPRYSIDHVLHPLHPLSITRSHMSSDSQASIRKSSQESTMVNPSTPAFQPLQAHNRNDSYLEAVVEVKEQKGCGANTPAKGPKIAVLRPSRPSDLPILPTYSNVGGPQQLDTINTSTVPHTFDESQTSCLVDDVFLPSHQRPIGIYEVLKSYDKQADGEVSISRGEYVIVMQMGYGEWALVITSANTEGLVPRGHLCRYSPLAHRKVSVGTQTELIIMAPVVHQHSTTSSSSSATSRLERDIICIRDIRPTSTPKKNHGREMAIQTNCSQTPPYPMDSAWEDSRLDFVDDPWYENSMSIPRLPQNDSLYTNEAPSICTLPNVNGVVNHVQGEAPLAFHSSRESLPQFPLRNGYNVMPPLSLGPPKRVGPNMNDNFSPGALRRTLKEQSEWPMSPGILSNFSEFSSSSPRSPQMTILKATKEYTPDVDGTNYLSLKKGDILQLIPAGGNNPKGWLWVQHVRQRCYGYVPTSHVTNVCSLDPKHKNGIVTMYDEV